MLATLLAIVGLVPAPPPPAVYVDPASRGGHCSDERSGREAGSPRSPLCSIPRAMKEAPEDREIVLRGGRYGPLDVDRGDRTFRSYGAERAAVSQIVVSGGADNLRFRGLRLRSFKVAEGGSRNIQLTDSVISDPPGDAILLEWGTSDVLIAGNRINSKSGGNGISFASTSCLPGSPSCDPLEPIRRVTIRNNRVVPGVDAIRPANFEDVLIEGNEITGVIEDGRHNDALQVVYGGRGLTFRRNYVHDNTGQGFFIKDGQVREVAFENNLFVRNRDALQFQSYDTIGLRMFNNTFWGNDGSVILRRGLRRAVLRNNVIDNILLEADEPDPGIAPSVDQDYNIVTGGFNWGARGRHDIRSRPRFAGPDDFRLAAGSPGVDAGTSIGAPRRDRLGRPRFDDPSVPDSGQGGLRFYDIGAFERGALALRSLSLSRRRFAGRTAIRFGLSGRARVVYRIERARRTRRGRLRYRRVARFVRRARVGGNRKRLTRRIGRRRLAPGLYRLSLVAVDAAGTRTRPARVRFRVLG